MRLQYLTLLVPKLLMSDFLSYVEKLLTCLEAFTAQYNRDGKQYFNDAGERLPHCPTYPHLTPL